MAGDGIVFEVTLGELSEVPGSPYAYWAPPSLRALFQKDPPLDRDLARLPEAEKIADVKVGLQTSDDLRFTRFWWEVPVPEIAMERDETCQGKKWVPYAKGGQPFYHDLAVVVNWWNDGTGIKGYRNTRGRQLSRPQNVAFYFQGGLAWTKSGWIANEPFPRLDVGVLPAGSIFTAKRMAIFLSEGSGMDNFLLCAFLRSIVAVSLIHLVNPTGRNREAGQIAQIPISSVIYNNSKLSQLAHESYDLLREWDAGSETSTQFITPWLLQVYRGFNPGLKPVNGHPLARDFTWSDWTVAKEIRGEGLGKWSGPVSLRALAEEAVRREAILRQRLNEIQRQIDEEVYRLYDISAEDRRLIEAELAESRVDEVEDEPGETNSDVEDDLEAGAIDLIPAEEHILRLLQYAAHRVISAESEGIVPLNRLHLADGREKEGLVEGVRRFLAKEFGEMHLSNLDEEITAALGKTLAAWLEEDFFPFHLSLYRLRPIIWQITSRSFGSAGRGRGGNQQAAINCFIYWHRLTGDTLYRIQHLYLRPLIEAADRERERLQREAARWSELPAVQRRQREEEQQSALERLAELEGFNQAIDQLLRPLASSPEVVSRSKWVQQKVGEITERGYRPNLDYGVRVNIEPLKQLNLLPRDGSRVKG